MRMVATATAALLLFAGETYGAYLQTFASVEDTAPDPCNFGSEYGSSSAGWDTGWCYLIPGDPLAPIIAGSAFANATFGSVNVGVAVGSDHSVLGVSAHARARFADRLTFSDPSAAFLKLFFAYTIAFGEGVIPTATLDLPGLSIDVVLPSDSAFLLENHTAGVTIPVSSRRAEIFMDLSADQSGGEGLLDGLQVWATLDHAILLSSQGVPLTGFEVHSDSGTAYPVLTSGVPEPGTAILLVPVLFGLLFVGAMMRRRSNINTT